MPTILSLRILRLLPASVAVLLLSGCFSSGSQSAPEQSSYVFNRRGDSAEDASRDGFDQPSATTGAHSAAMKRLKGGANGVSLLMEGAKQGNESLVRTQLAEGVRVNAIDRRGETALAHAIRHERHDVALLLISEGANVNLRDAEGNTPLNCLCLGPSHYPLHRDSADGGNYSLNDSFYKGRRKVLQALLTAKADTNLRDAEGVTPLMRALWCSWQPTVDVLVVDAGANTRSIEAHTFSDEESRRWPGLAAQSLSERSGDKSGVVDTSASLSATSVAGSRYEPLRFTAVYRTEDEMIRKLIAAGADPDGRNARDCKVAMGPAGGTPLVVAAAMGDSSVVSLLIKAGADVNARDDDGRTALMHAALRGDSSMARKLLSAGADRSLKDHTGRTASQCALSKGYTSLAETLDNPSAYRRFINAISSIFE